MLSGIHLEIDNARRHVEALRIALLSPSPDEIERCLPSLEEAVRCLAAAERGLRDGSGGGPELGPRLESLKSELRIVDRMIGQGAAFYRSWAKLLGAATAGYMPTGEVAPIPRPMEGTGSVSLRG
jgi:hypothetical protein